MYRGPQILILGFIHDVSSFLNKHPSCPHLQVFAEHMTVQMLFHYTAVVRKLCRCMRMRRDGEWEERVWGLVALVYTSKYTLLNFHPLIIHNNPPIMQCEELRKLIVRVGESAVNQIHPYFSGNSPVRDVRNTCGMHVEIGHKTSEIDQVFTCVNSSKMFDYMMILNR